MAKAPKAALFDRSDFGEQASWIDRLLRPLNSFFTDTSAALSGKLTLEDNVMAQTQELVITTPGAVADAFPVYFTPRFPAKPRHLIVTRAENLTTPTATFANAVSCSWENSNDGRVKINLVSGLTTATKYRLTLLVFP